ncbi:MAG: hypothetical protein M5R36_10365 [Deltaproteobacteria bacterium]|nr:hypothetical protein [Deltaproteobacteria bacterium]
MAEGLFRIAAGAFKALVLGAALGKMAEPIMGIETNVDGIANFLRISVGGLWLSLFAYGFHIYLNFSGYSDIAIGLARLHGYTIMENFRWPYLATNIGDFWRRWHISLTGWVTDYVYIPLGGNRRGTRIATINTFIAMILVGVWHGLSMHFVWWGAYQALLLVIYRQWRTHWHKKSKLRDIPGWRYMAWALTFFFFNLGWVLFVLPLDPAINVYLKLFGLQYTGFTPELFTQHMQ